MTNALNLNTTLAKTDYTINRRRKGFIIMRKFSIILYSGEDGYILAECPEFKNCMTQGKTIDEAIKNIKECIELLLEVQEETKSNKFLGTFEVEV